MIYIGFASYTANIFVEVSIAVILTKTFLMQAIS